MRAMYTTPAVRGPISAFDKHHERQADLLIDYAIELMEAVVAGRA